MSEEVKEKLENKRKISFLGEGILIAVLTAVGYAIAYYYDKGYKGYFFVPDSFVDLNITMIIKSIGLTVIVGFFIFMILDSLVVTIRNIRSINEAIRYKLDEYIWIFNISLFFILLLGINIISVISFVLLMGYIAFIQFFMPIVKFKGVKGYRNKMISSVGKRVEKKKPTNGLISSIINQIGQSNVRLIIYILFAIAALPNFALIGEYYAMSQTKFLVIEGKPNYVMVGTYKDHAVVAELDAKNKVVIPNYKLIKNEGFKAKLYDVGELNVARPETLK